MEPTPKTTPHISIGVLVVSSAVAIGWLAVAAIGAVLFFAQDKTDANLTVTDALVPAPLEIVEPENATYTGDDEDGVSRGFAIEEGFVSEELYAYQIGAFVEGVDAAAQWPSMRFAVSLPGTTEPLPSGSHGSLWIGATLDNGYFVQLGYMSTEETDANGDMLWSYFWQVWDDEDTYLYGLQEPLATYEWQATDEHIFTISCQDPDTGTWEFWVNDITVGRTSTGECDVTYTNAYVFWELTTPEQTASVAPEFGPFELGNMEYWDDTQWLPVEDASISYSYGRVVDGTTVDADAVCPPYGATPNNAATFTVGSGVDCTPIGEAAW